MLGTVLPLSLSPRLRKSSVETTAEWKRTTEV